MQEKPDLSAIREKLENIFKTYPAGNYCDVCAGAVAQELHKAGFESEIITLQNEEMPGQKGLRPPYIHGRKPDGQQFLLGQTGFHQCNRIRRSQMSYYIDSLVYFHQGVEMMDEVTYFSLFLYPDGLQITHVRIV
jgi:hypothetical protein